MRIGLLHPGEMGAALGGIPVQLGHEVIWVPEGRSAASAGRANDAGREAVASIGEWIYRKFSR